MLLADEAMRSESQVPLDWSCLQIDLAFGAELLGSEEGLDGGQYCRGASAEVMGYPMLERLADEHGSGVVAASDGCKRQLRQVPCGSQKSLAFTIAWLRHTLRRDNARMPWTATDNMFMDGGTHEA